MAEILTELEQDLETVAAGLLHDVVEDTEVTLEDIEAEFGPGIALLVDGVTKLMRLRFQSKAQQQVENLRKMFMAMATDFRVIIIKFADRPQYAHPGASAGRPPEGHGPGDHGNLCPAHRLRILGFKGVGRPGSATCTPGLL